MSNVDFVPSDYKQQRESNRANFLYLVLFSIVMAAIGVTFSAIKVRQSAVESELSAVMTKMSQAHDSITQLEDLKNKSKTMMKTMVLTAELLEPVPRSVVLAALTNNLPGGVSLIEMSLKEKVTKAAPAPVSKGKYKTVGAKTEAAAEQPAKSTETNIEIVGIAPSDIEVANFISRLSDSILLENVSLVESKEHKIEETRFREFKLKAKLKKNMVLTKEDMKRIRQKRQEGV
jgi:Tfp pilus assembly protein PilN